eukprot:gene10819-1967_t
MQHLTAFALAGLAASQDPMTITATDCGTSGTIIRMGSVDFSPAKYTTGMNVTMTPHLISSASITGGTYTFTATLDDVPVCGDEEITLPFNYGSIAVTDVKCPQAAGKFDTMWKFFVDESAQYAEVKVKMTATTEDKKALWCLDLDVNIQ